MGHIVDTITPAGTVRAVFTDRTDGDFSIHSDPSALQRNRRGVIDRPWTWLHQVHGSRVVEVTEAGQWAGSEADGAVTRAPLAPLAVMTADCAPVVLIAEQGFAVVHAGWRGLVAGIVEEAARKLGELNAAAPIGSLVGPCINAAAYEFSEADLSRAADRLGSAVRSETRWGTPALDVPAAVGVACERAGWPPPPIPPACTSDERWFSHRSRAEPGRQVAVAWLEPLAPSPSPQGVAG